MSSLFIFLLCSRFVPLCLFQHDIKCSSVKSLSSSSAFVVNIQDETIVDAEEATHG